ncbi:MAG: anti-sigma factor, partial [Armatimonadota bacterium]
MNCEKALELFSDYFEGRLNQGLREAVERHLAACPSCQVEYEQFASVVGSISYPKPPSPPADLGEKIVRRLDRIDWERRSRRPSPLRVFLPVAAAGAVVLSIVLFNRASEPPKVVSSGASTPPEVVLQEPLLGTRVLEGGRVLSLFGTEGSTYTILEG